MKLAVPVKGALALVAFAGLVFGVVACTDEEKVFIEKPLFEDPPEAAAGFLGYDESAEKLTVCGNCHVGQQSGWEETAHADAWAGLQNSGHSQAFCEGCHTVGQLGNPEMTDVGWDATGDPRYHDVQCESCHGPGQNHVANPDASQPLAPIAVALDLGCGECHSDTHHPFVEDWMDSDHAVPNQTVIDRAASDPAHYGYCLECHSGQGALEAWGVNASYVEEDDPVSEHVGFTCAVCHDPHESRNSGQLRFPIDVPSVQGNLCMKCHNKRGEPETDAATVRGPHSPQGPLLLGEAGWFPPGFEPEVSQIRGTHGTVGNPRLCASCHVASYDVTDQETGEFVLTVTGHRFEAIPCVDSNGQPTGEDDCGIEDRRFADCATSGCHGDANAARAALLDRRSTLGLLIEDVRALLEMVPEGELDNSDGVFTVADGANFNVELAVLDGTAAHNPYLATQLLIASMNALEAEYDLPPGIARQLLADN